MIFKFFLRPTKLSETLFAKPAYIGKVTHDYHTASPTPSVITKLLVWFSIKLDPNQ